jgi:acetyl esterase/lipase
VTSRRPRSSIFTPAHSSGAKVEIGEVMFVQYRLASDTKSPFPSALQDSVIAYQYLDDHGILARRIMVSGDLAGGNIAIALLCYLTSHRIKEMPCPAALLL